MQHLSTLISTNSKPVQAVYDKAEDRVSNDDMGSEAYEAYLSQYSFLENQANFQELYTGLRTLMDATTVDCVYYLLCRSGNNVCRLYY